MAKHGKKFTAAASQVEDRPYTFEEAMPLLQKVKFAKFDETVEVALRLRQPGPGRVPDTSTALRDERRRAVDLGRRGPDRGSSRGLQPVVGGHRVPCR